MSDAPPLKKRPTWYAATTVEPDAKVSGSTSVACWLVVLVNGSALTRVSGTFARAGAARASSAAAASAPSTATDRTEAVRIMALLYHRSRPPSTNRTPGRCVSRVRLAHVDEPAARAGRRVRGRARRGRLRRRRIPLAAGSDADR